MTNNKCIKGKYHERKIPKHVFGFAEHQEKAICGLGYKITLTRDTDNAVLNKENAINKAKVKIIAVEWFKPHYTPSISNPVILSQQISSKAPTELQYVERSVFFLKKKILKIYGLLNLAN